MGHIYLQRRNFKNFFKKSIDKDDFILYNYIAVKRFAIYALFDFT